jgi:hypothetical protein
MTRKRCPNGSHRNKKTNKCNKTKKKTVKTPKKVLPKKVLPKKDKCPPCTPCPPCPPCQECLLHAKKSITPQKSSTHTHTTTTKIEKKRKRCPKGTRKNKKTGICQKSIPAISNVDPIGVNIINVPNVENIEDLGKVVHTTVKSLIKEKTEILKTVNTPSFTPEINKRLETLNIKTPNEIIAYGCIEREKQENLYDGLDIEDMKDILKGDQHFDAKYLARMSKSVNVNDKSSILKKLVHIAKNPPNLDLIRVKVVRVKVGNTVANQEYKCLKWNNKLLRTFVLQNLNSKKNIDFTRIIGPQQYLSNCWFNTAMMCLFISDKGRKFTRVLRENMILGKLKPNNFNAEINEKIKKILFMYNIIIDNALRGILDVSVNTNYIIQSLHNINKEISKDFVNVDEASNPLSFFDNFNSLMPSPKINMKKYTCFSLINKRDIAAFKERIKNNMTIDGNVHDIIVVEFYDVHYKVEENLKGELLGLEYTNSNGKKIKATHTMTVNTKAFGKINYKLDSAVLRSNNKSHFTAYITGNKKEYKFDGHSKSGLQPFEWKKMLNINKNFNFKKDETPKHWKRTIYNFTKAYNLLFYYRV